MKSGIGEKSGPSGRTLITGAAGFVAFHLIESLLRSRQDVVGIDNFDPFYPRAVKEKNLADLRRIAAQTGSSFEFHEADIRDFQFDSFDQKKVFVKKPIENIIHLAAKAGVRPSLIDPEDYVSVNVQGTVRLLEYARVRGIENFVFGSSSSVYGDDSEPPFREESLAVLPISPYSATKRAGELLCSTYCHLYGLKIAALRFFTVYGPRQRPDLAIHKFTKLISKREPITLYGDGETSRDYTFVSDITQGVESALRWVRTQARPGEMEIFNLGGSRTTSLIQLVKMIEKELGVSARIKWDSMQPGDVMTTFADISKSARVLGYRSDFPIEAGIRSFVQWFNASVEQRAQHADLNGMSAQV